MFKSFEGGKPYLEPGTHAYPISSSWEISLFAVSRSCVDSRYSRDEARGSDLRFLVFVQLEYSPVRGTPHISGIHAHKHFDLAQASHGTGGYPVVGFHCSLST